MIAKTPIRLMHSSTLPHFSGYYALAAALALLPAALTAATEIHIAPSGNDANPGTAVQPVATPRGAQDRVRTLIQAGLSDSVEVIFAAGTYVMAAPLELRPEDSGTAAFPVIWKAAAGAEVVLSGGRQITSTWTTDGGGIWHTDLAGVGLGPNQWNFRQLFINGSQAMRARFPNVTEDNPFLYATGASGDPKGAYDHLVITPSLIKASWGTAADAQINVVPQSRFFNQWNTVTGVNTTTGRIDIADSERHRLINSGSWFWIEGIHEELDQPGEWFLNPTTGRLYYMPPTGVNPNNLDIVAPFLNRIVNVKGDVNAGTHVANVTFDGLKFRHTTFTLGHIEARVHTDTAIMFENTNSSSVINCDFENIGGYALWLHLDSQHNVFDRNTVRYSGGGGVLLTGSRLGYMDDSKVYTPGTAAAKVAPILNRITRNTVEHCGRIRYYGGGVHLDSRPFSMTMAPGNYIAHNHFNDLSRNGVFAFRNQGGNVVEYNHIHNAMQTTIDGGCIHFATMNTLNAPNHIRNNWLYDAWGYNRKPNDTPERKLANGIFLDWDTSNTIVKDNWIYNIVGGAVKVIFGGNQNVTQSDNPSSETVITPPFVKEIGPDGTATHGIDMETNKLTGSIISYTDTANFSKTGTWKEETATGIVNLFEFEFLTGTAAAPSQATFKLPITEDGTYQISLLYKPGTDRASKVPVTIDHADGIANVRWNMKRGSRFGFAVPVGTFRFVASETNTVTLGTTGTDGKVIVDSVAFVKVADHATTALPPVATPEKKPNIVLIMADDLGYGSLGCYGSKDIKTPHIDQLAADGMRFTDFHSNGAVCTPTRAALMTGRYPQRCAWVADEELSPVFREQRKDNLRQRWAWGIAPNELTIAELLQQAGYHTGLIGKWHLGYDAKFHPMTQGFEEFRGFVGGNVDYHTHVAGYGLKQLDWWKGKILENEDGYTTDLLTKYAADFISRNKDQPFFLYLAHGAPHDPWLGRDSDKKKSPVETYKEMIEVLDESVGTITDTLRENHLERDTLLIFCSDNGAAAPRGVPANGCLQGRKGSMLEGGHRVPLIASWPDVITAGNTNRQTVMTMDFFPTFAKLAGATPPDGHPIDGTDIMPLLKNDTKQTDRTLHWLYGDAWAVRKGSWKLIGQGANTTTLVNLEQDIQEKSNHLKDQPELVDELMKLHRQWIESVGSQ